MKSEAKTIINIIDAEKKELEYKQKGAMQVHDNEAIYGLKLQIQAEKYFCNDDDIERINKIIKDNFIIDISNSVVRIDPNKLYLDIEDKTVISPVAKAINLDNIIEINTIKED